MMYIHVTFSFSKKNHSTELFKIFFSLLTLYTAFLQKASGPGKMFDFEARVLIGWLSQSIRYPANQNACLNVKLFFLC